MSNSGIENVTQSSAYLGASDPYIGYSRKIYVTKLDKEKKYSNLNICIGDVISKFLFIAHGVLLILSQGSEVLSLYPAFMLSVS